VAKAFYDLLDVAPEAPAEEIKRAFRREIAKYHPDKVQHLGKEFQDIAASKAAELTRAYKTLTDPSARAEYDASGDGTRLLRPHLRQRHPHRLRRGRQSLRNRAGHLCFIRNALAHTIWSSAQP
jgi:DnaJ-class molecular chaperone